MSAVDSFNNHLKRLKSKRGENIHYQRTAQNIGRFTHPFNYMSNQMAQSMVNQEAPMSARLQLNRDRAGDYNQFTHNIFSDASVRDLERKDALDMQITDVEFQRDETRRMEKEQEKYQKRAMWQAGLTAVGQIGGNIIAPGFGGTIGGGLGQMLGSIFNASYPQDWGSMLSGASSIVGGISQGIADKNQRNHLKEIQLMLDEGDDIEKILLKYIGRASESGGNLFTQMQQARETSKALEARRGELEQNKPSRVNNESQLYFNKLISPTFEGNVLEMIDKKRLEELANNPSLFDVNSFRDKRLGEYLNRFGGGDYGFGLREVEGRRGLATEAEVEGRRGFATAEEIEIFKKIFGKMLGINI